MSGNQNPHCFIQSSALGAIVVQPSKLLANELREVALVVFPYPLSEDEFATAVEWAASTQTPIFCLPSEIKKFEVEGFGTYRFHKIDGYREFDFQGGTIEFFPARRRRLKGIKGLTQEMAEFMGWTNNPGYHVFVRPKLETPVLFLTNNVIDTSEWKSMTKVDPSFVVGSLQISEPEWKNFSKFVKREILTVQKSPVVKTQKIESAQIVETFENPLWAVKSGSL